jgi:hypothetical protein
MLKLFFTILTSLFCSLLSSGQANAQSLKSYIPQGYSILDSASGYLNNDTYKDVVLILKYKYENIGADTTRPLLLLAGTKKNNHYSLMAKNDSVVLCKECGGIFGDPFQGITIKRGYFSIEHYGGSSWRWTRIITFKYSIKTKQFLLHRDAGVSYHNTENPIKETKLISNKSDFGKLNFINFSYAK